MITTFYAQTLLARHVVVLVFMEGVLLWRLYSSAHKEPEKRSEGISDLFKINLHFIHPFLTLPAISF